MEKRFGESFAIAADAEAAMSSEDGHDAGALSRANQQQARIHRLERLSSGDSSMVGEHVHKVCCVCGEILNHKPRFKDREGRYWCPTCNAADHEKVRPVPCADCGIEVPRADMKELHGVMLCPVCVEKFLHDSKAMAEVRLQALVHSQQVKQTPSSNIPVQKIVVAVALLLAAILILIYRLS